MRVDGCRRRSLRHSASAFTAGVTQRPGMRDERALSRWRRGHHQCIRALTHPPRGVVGGDRASAGPLRRAGPTRGASHHAGGRRVHRGTRVLRGRLARRRRRTGGRRHRSARRPRDRADTRGKRTQGARRARPACVAPAHLRGSCTPLRRRHATRPALLGGDGFARGPPRLAGACRSAATSHDAAAPTRSAALLDGWPRPSWRVLPGARRPLVGEWAVARTFGCILCAAGGFGGRRGRCAESFAARKPRRHGSGLLLMRLIRCRHGAPDPHRVRPDGRRPRDRLPRRRRGRVIPARSAGLRPRP